MTKELEESPEINDLEDSKMAFFRRIDAMARSRLITGAFRMVDRANFIPEGRDRTSAYKDEIINLGEQGVSISQPSLTALMIDCLGLTGKERVLEIGTASGYSAAVLSLCASEVYTVESNGKLSQLAEKRLKGLGYNNVYVHHGDGALGLPTYAPYDGIIVTAGVNGIPEALMEQLAPYGRLVIPVGRDPKHQRLIVGIKYPDQFLAKEELDEVVFYPLISNERGGWTAELIMKAQKFKKKLFLESARQHGLSEEDVIKEKAVKLDIPPEAFDLDEYIAALRFPEQVWSEFEEYLRLYKRIMSNI